MRGGGRKTIVELLAAEDRQRLSRRAHDEGPKGPNDPQHCEVSSEILLVPERRLQVLFRAPSGRKILRRELMGNPFFRKSAAIDRAARSASIIAATDAVLRATTRQLFQPMLVTSPAASEWMTERLTRQVRSLTNLSVQVSLPEDTGR